MIEWVIAILLTPYALIAVALLSVVFDHNEAPGWTSFALVVLTSLAYFYFGATWAQLAIAAGAWIGLGVLHSWFHWSRHCSKAVSDYKYERITKYAAQARTVVGNNKGMITYWAYAWPIVATTWILSDALTWMGRMLQFTFGNAYHWVSRRSQSQIDEIAIDRGDNK